MAGLFPVVAPIDNSEERDSRLTVVAVADILGNASGLAKYVAGDNSVSLVSCSDLKQAVKFCRQTEPCVVVADKSFLATIDLAEFVKTAGSERLIAILIVVDEDDSKFCQELLKMAFAGAIQRTAPADVFRQALGAVAQGELWASRKTISAVVREFLFEASPERLTSREKEILGLVAKGYKNREIADALFVSRETVRWHLRSIYSKLRVPDRKRVIEYALAEGITRAAKPSVGQGPGNTQRQACS